jgi:hypothetical protein
VSESRIEVLESKLEQMRTKLRSVKEELKESQTQLAQARTAASKPASSRGDIPAKNPRKRGAIEMSTDDAIGTPDGVVARKRGPAVKRGRPDQTMLGEKSMFSITPFLNKTVNLIPDSPAGEEVGEEAAPAEANSKPQEEDEAALEAPTEEDVASPSVPKPKAKKKPAERKAVVERKILGEAKSGPNSKKTAPKKQQALSTLDKVVEEEADENEEPAPILTAKSEAAKPFKVQLKNAEEAQPQKKKRKLLGGGKTLFDEEDGEGTKRPAKVNLGPRSLGKGGLAGPKGGLKGGLGAASGFGGFSPLKKERRQASFLA